MFLTTFPLTHILVCDVEVRQVVDLEAGGRLEAGLEVRFLVPGEGRAPPPALAVVSLPGLRTAAAATPDSANIFTETYLYRREKLIFRAGEILIVSEN